MVRVYDALRRAEILETDFFNYLSESWLLHLTKWVKIEFRWFSEER